MIFGPPKATSQQEHERLGVAAALAVFSSDGLSSVAYATEEILYVLMAAGTAAAVYSLPIGLAIIGLVFIVAASYSQTIQAYPSGGGSYVVSSKNLGPYPGLVAGAALLIDYVLTVAVSATAGVAAVVSAVPALHGHEVALGLAAIWLIAWVNLRGVKESGQIFAIPTYGFLLCILMLIAWGGYRMLTGLWHPAAPWSAGFHPGGAAVSGVTWFLLLRAFSSGCTALTGLEAVSNGVQAFRPPEERNAMRTMGLERTILYVLFGGITLLAFGLHVLPRPGETVLSQIAREIFGQGPMYYAVQASTALILLLAANTAYADFPRLAGLIARDGYLPRRLANRGDTLVFHHGIYLLGALASGLVVLFHGDTHHLIPLYAVGVFTAFTLSQSGMVVHWVRQARSKGASVWRYWRRLVPNAAGALLCAIVLVMVAATKFTHGAWVVLIVVPGLVAYMAYVGQYYRRFRGRVRALATARMTIGRASRVKVVVAIGGLTPVVDHALRVGRQLSRDVHAVYVAVDPDAAARIQRKWRSERPETRLTVLPSPYRDVVAPLRVYLDQMLINNPRTIVNLLVPVVVTNDPFDAYLHNGTAEQLLRELRYSEGIIVTEIPFYVDMSARARRVIAYRRRRGRVEPFVPPESQRMKKGEG